MDDKSRKHEKEKDGLVPESKQCEKVKSTKIEKAVILPEYRETLCIALVKQIPRVMQNDVQSGEASQTIEKTSIRFRNSIDRHAQELDRRGLMSASSIICRRVVR